VTVSAARAAGARNTIAKTAANKCFMNTHSY
jgi:hypothetical protein